jgi:G3E family GTPase
MEQGDLASKIYPASEICIVDARSFADRRNIFKQVEQAVSYADTVVLNKCDLCSVSEIASAEAEIIGLNPFCRILNTSYCRLEVGDVLSEVKLVPEFQKKQARGSSCPPVEVKTKVLNTAKILPEVRKDDFLLWAADCIRAKGFFNCSDRKRYILQSASGLAQAAPVAASSAVSQMVFMGLDPHRLNPLSFFV